MLTRIRRICVVSAFAVLAVTVTGPSIAYAGGTEGTVCNSGSRTCTVSVSKPGSPGHSSSSGRPRPTPSLKTTAVSGPCTYAPDPSYKPPAGDTADQRAGKQGGWYLVTCPVVALPGAPPIAPRTTTTEAWLATLPPTPAMKPAPATLAASARKKLRLSVPVISSSPRQGLPQLVEMPMWNWLPKALFAPVSATASVPGEAVTATAKPVSVLWDFGDGTSMTCAGAGTPFPADGDPGAPSPTCGHTYSHSSGNGTFMIRATLIWNVTWKGGGQAGAFNGMTTTATGAVRVEQSQALVTGS